MYSGRPSSAADVSLAEGKHAVPRPCRYSTIQLIVDGDLDLDLAVLRQQSGERDDVMASVTPPVIHPGSGSNPTSHDVFDIASGGIADHLLKLGVHGRRARLRHVPEPQVGG